ncbi:MAG: ATP-binding protein [Alphaproteobacteria bacterium]
MAVAGIACGAVLCAWARHASAQPAWAPPPGQSAGALPPLDAASALVGAAVVAIAVGLVILVRSLRRGRRPPVDATLAASLLRESPGAVLTWTGRDIEVLCGETSPLAPVRHGRGGRPATLDDVAAVFASTDAVRLKDAATRLRESGRAFEIRLSGDADATDLLAQGRRIDAGGRSLDAIWFFDISELARRNRKQQREIDALDHAHRAVVGLLDALAFPAWVRAPDLRLTYVNPAYARAVDQKDTASAVRDGREIGGGVLGADGRALAREAKRTTTTQVADHHVVLGSERRFMRFIEHALADGRVAGIAIDRTEIDEARDQLRRHVEAHAAVLHNIAVPIAMFAADGHLTFHNRTYAETWGLDPEWLGHGPSLGEVLEALREKRKVPEYADFPAFKREQMRMFKSLLTAQEDLVHLPDGATFRRVVSPHPFGGLIFSFEDVTDRLNIERNYNTTVAVHRETLASMHEGIAVFGSDGRLKLSNPAFASQWHLDQALLDDQPHVRDVAAWCRPLLGGASNGAGGPADEIVDQVMQRRAAAGTVERTDGILLDYAAVPLPDGNIMFSYIDVTDSVRAARALEERAQALEAADRLKSEFLATVSYELRTPLNAIIGFSEILDNGYFGSLNERQLEYTRDILDASNRLLSLIDDILDLASIEAGRLELEYTKVQVPAMLDGIAAVTREWARKQGLEIELDCPRNVGAIDADEGRIKQVLFNLVSNAIKFTPSGGRITLSARRADGRVRIAVADTGIGIEEEFREKVFDSFTRGKGGSRQAGPGLGLSLVKNVIELHGGSIAVADNPGGGVVFAFTLPIQAATDAPARPPAPQAAGPRASRMG